MTFYQERDLYRVQSGTCKYFLPEYGSQLDGPDIARKVQQNFVSWLLQRDPGRTDNLPSHHRMLREGIRTSQGSCARCLFQAACSMEQ